MITQIIPSYLYQQYADDSDLQAFVNAYNTLAQEYLDWFNNLNLPIYTKQNGASLDWVAQGLYGLQRPALPTPTTASLLGVYDTVPYDTTAYTQNITSSPTSFYVVTDDYFKRIITWNFYKGDGFQYNTQWLKRRIARFIYGVDGTDIPNIADIYNVSVVYTAPNTIAITIPNLAISPIFKSAIQAGVLNVPFQYNYTITY